MKTIEQALIEISGRFDTAGLSYGHGVEDAWDEAVWLIYKSIGADMETESLDWDRTLSEIELAKMEELCARRIESRLPFAYLVNETWFAGLKFFIDERALVPRSFLGEWIPERFEPWIEGDSVKTVLDLCTGSGCIAIACATFFEDVDVIASDISADALSVARVNVQKHGLEDRVTLNEGDLFDGIDQRFDLIVCNPPYVSDERMDSLSQEYRFEPELALRAGVDGLDFVRRFLKEAGNYLTDDGAIVVEVGSASFALEEECPRIPFTRLTTEYDEMVVFIMTARELDQYHLQLS